MNKILLAVLSGIAVGILIAPAKGADTRKKIREKYNRVGDDLNKFSNRSRKDKRMVENALNTILHEHTAG